jgi:S-adenosylmethionine:tRNA ribosyltransferase-isomerase
MKTSDFDYKLPSEQIAQIPIEPRHDSRLLIMNRQAGMLEHTTFWHIGDYLQPGDLLVINHTRVIPARIYAQKPSGGKVEILLLRRQDETSWEALVGGKRILPGMLLTLKDGTKVLVDADLGGSRRLLRVDRGFEDYLGGYGHMPLPPYIHSPLVDPDRYQTVYAMEPGSAAAPTAGLHFTPQLMKRLENQGIRFARLTLHVGLDTFAPVNEEDPLEHTIHTEWCELDEGAVEMIRATRRANKRIIAVGTTSVRTLESAAQAAEPGEYVKAISGPTNLFILPGYTYRIVDAMITNFHLPRSTLLMLVSAFTGREQILDAYRTAVEEKYRFYSFGDAMFIC